MTDPTVHAELLANWARGQESLQVARELLAQQHYDIATSRAYYAAFYAAVTLLLHRNQRFGKHSGVVAAIHHELVKTGILSMESGRALQKLFELRGIGDYGSIQHVNADEAKLAVEKAERFVAEARTVLNKAGVVVD